MKYGKITLRYSQITVRYVNFLLASTVYQQLTYEPLHVWVWYYVSYIERLQPLL